MRLKSRFSSQLLVFGLSAAALAALDPQIPLRGDLDMGDRTEFALKEGADRFTPKDLIQLPRPGQGIPSPDGDLVLVQVAEYSFEEKKNNQRIYISPLDDSQGTSLSILVPNGGSAFWLNARTVAHVICDEEAKISELYAVDIQYNMQAREGPSASADPVLIGKIPGETAANFRYNSREGWLAFSAYVYPDGNISAVNGQDEVWEKRGNTALVYDATYERHWDKWTGPKQLSLFSVRLSVGSDHNWSLGSDFLNLLKDTGHSCPIEPFGGTDDFDLSDSHVVYTTLDPSLPKAWHTRQDIYLIPIDGSGKLKKLSSGTQGATHGPVFSNKGNKVAWLELDEDGYEADRAKIVIYDLDVDVRFTITQHWDRSPTSLVFSTDDHFLYVTAGDHAKTKIFVLPIPPTPSSSTAHPDLAPIYRKPPVALTHSGGSSGLYLLSGGRLLFTRSSFTSPNDVYVMSGVHDLQTDILRGKAQLADAEDHHLRQVTQFAEKHLQGKGLSKGEEFWFKGAEGRDVHGWVLKPKGWEEGQVKRWPVVLLIHGGPQDAWQDQWSTRWNPNVHAQQGYFVVAINPTGSTTFGQEFTDAIAEDWGGKPFVDMQAGWRYILNTYPEIDADRAVAAGASWGGYAINWIQGHPEFGFGFKALVCHDGVFDSTYNGYSTDELFFFNHEWGGRPWEPKSKALAEKYNPTNFVQNWTTPQLVIHGSKDYRLPETDGIGAFHALQQKGIPSRLVIFPDENHWVLQHGNSLKWHYEVFRWFEKFVGP